VVMFEVEVLCVVTPCSVVVGYQRFILRMEAAWTSDALVPYQCITRRHNPEDFDSKLYTVSLIHPVLIIRNKILESYQLLHSFSYSVS